MVAPLVIGALLAAAQTEQQRQEMKRQQAVEAGKARYSPWTGMTPQTGNIHAPSTVANFGSAMTTMQDMAQKNPDLFKSGSAGAAGATAGPGTTEGMTGAVPPMGESAPYQGTPAGAAMNAGQFPKYAQNAYFGPWSIPPGGQPPPPNPMAPGYPARY